jgi:hypothetical protein
MRVDVCSLCGYKNEFPDTICKNERCSLMMLQKDIWLITLEDIDKRIEETLK